MILLIIYCGISLYPLQAVFVLVSGFAGYYYCVSLSMMQVK